MFNWRTGESKQVGEGKPKTVQELEGEAAEKHPDGIMGFEAEKAGKIAKAQQGASGRKIDRWVDLGNRVRIYYLDGTTEEAEKGTSPNTILNVDSRNDQRDFRNETAMRKEFLQLPEVKTHSEIYGQLGRAQSAYHASLKPGTNLVAIDQTLITVLNKMLDPTSVVRESEYARTPQNMAALNRIKGKMQNIMQGGANLADEDRKALVQMIDQFYKISKTKFDVKRKYYSNLATRYGYSPENIVQPEWGVEGQGNSPAPNTTPAPSGLPEKSSAASQPERNQMQALPPATAHKGRIIRDTATGERYQSDGVRWNKIK